jgi:aminomethyltransferase
MLVSSVPSAMGQVKGGKLRPLAVTSAKRSSSLPDVPIVAELGYKGFDVSSWYGLLVPAGTPAHLVTTLNTEVNKLLANPEVKPIGLGARDSLRLEAGLPLYGHDVDETVSPVEAGLTFAVSKKRRDAQDFPGAARIVKELAEGPARVRVGLKVLGGPPAREGAEIADINGKVVGVVTSGGFAPSLGCPIAMGFVPPALSAVGTKLNVIVRGRAGAAEVVAMPFVPNRYVRKV